MTKIIISVLHTKRRGEVFTDIRPFVPLLKSSEDTAVGEAIRSRTVPLAANFTSPHHRPKAYPGRRNQRFTASTMPPCAVGVARQSPRAPYRTAGQPAALRKCMLVARRDGFHARSHSARAVKVEVRPGSSRHSNLITAKVSDPVPTSPATLNSRAPPGDRPALLSLPQAQLKRRLQRPASIGR